MAWTRVRGFAYQAPSEATSHSNALGGSVAVGDIICVCVRVGVTGSVGNSGATLSDSLGNTYTRQVRLTKDANNNSEMYFCKVTNAGSPTITVKYEPTPDTSNADDMEMVASHFTGSDSSSAVEGTPVINSQNSPGTGTDACTSTNATSTSNGCLVYGYWYGFGATGNVSVGTGFTIGSQTFTDGLTDEYKTQSTAGAVAATYTVAGGAGTTHTGVFLVKPAAAGAVIPVFMNQYRQRGN